MAWTLSKNNKVLFVEPPYTIFSPIKYAHINWRQLLNLGRLKYQGRNLYSYSPFKVLPLSLPFSQKYHYDEINKRVIFAQLKRVAEKLNIKIPILWTYFSMDQYEYYGLFDEAITVTDYYDKFSAPFGWEAPLDYKMKVRDLEKTMLVKADIAFAVSKELYDDIKNINPSSHYIPHGVDIEFYHKTKKSMPTIFRKLNKIGKPILGYLGAIQHKIDFNLLEYISDSHLEWSLVFVGKIAINNETDRADWTRLTKKRNVYYFGEINRELIPSVLDYFDICMIPFKKIERLHYAASPLKIWEYLAAGKPIIAINQNADFDYKHLINIVDDKWGFEKAIENILLAKEDNNLIKERKDIAMKNSWDNRVQQMLTIIDEYLSKKDKSENVY